MTNLMIIERHQKITLSMNVRHISC